MKKRSLTKIVTISAAAVMLIGSLAGCGKTANDAVTTETVADAADVAITEEQVATSDTISSAPYFTKGVYVNYADGVAARDYFYVFYDENAGYTEDGNTGMGLPFACKQSEGKIEFSFGGADENWDVFTITSTANGIITGAFDDGVTQNFELLSNVDPDGFSAENYMHPASEAVFEAANGWKVNYDANLFEVNQKDNLVTFVYTGECAGTNMITVTYDVTTNAEGAIDKMIESWGSDKATKTKSIFPGTENVDGYWGVLPPAEDGTGYYETAIARDYMDGCLVFELTGHNSGDDEMDMAVGDAMAMIIDSISFPFEQ